MPSAIAPLWRESRIVSGVLLIVILACTSRSPSALPSVGVEFGDAPDLTMGLARA